MPTSKWLPYVNAIQYDGTNGAEIATKVPPNTDESPAYTTVQSDNGTVLIIEMNHPTFGIYTKTLDLDDWLVIPGDHPEQGLYSCLVHPDGSGPAIDDIYRPSAEFESAPQALYTAVGKAALPALLLGGTTSPVVVFDTPMPDANYDLKWRAVSGAAVLASIVANGAVTKTASQVTIPLKAQGLASVAGVLLVEAFKLD